MFKFGLLWFMIHDPIPSMLNLINIGAIPVLIESKGDLHGRGHTIVEFRPL